MAKKISLLILRINIKICFVHSAQIISFCIKKRIWQQSHKFKIMRLSDLKNKPIAVLGYGLEGEAVIKYLLKHKHEPVLFDQISWTELSKSKQKALKKQNFNFILGPDAFKELTGFKIAFRSPGISLSNPDLARWTNLKITSQTKYFFDNCPAKIIGITGTKGKGTTASLIYSILKANSQKLKAKIYLTGNIGLTQPLDILDSLKKEDFVVFELSSFQLQDLKKSPHLSVVLMVTSEHLDYHQNLENYIQAKQAITKYQKPNNFAIINNEYKNSLQIGWQGKGKKVYFNKKIFPKFIEISNIKLRGKHNLENISAAMAVAEILGLDKKKVKKAVENFKGLEHRLEYLGKKRGVNFYNDSFSTTPETAIAAIRSFTEPLILILGGSSKKSDFTELGKVIRITKNIKTIILIGQEADRLKSAVGRTGIKILLGAKNMAEIFSQIRKVSVAGDVALLSPACASFGMFQNYKDRGLQFKTFFKKF